MRSVRFFACIAAVGAVGSVGTGCSGSSSTPTSNEYDDVAQSTAALVITASGGGEIGSMYDSASLAVGVTPGDVNVNASGTFGAVTAGVTYTFTVSCTDASGAAMSHCGPATNDALASVSWSGDLTLPNFNATVSRQGNWSLSGVQTGTATFGGSGSFTFASQFESIFRNEQTSTNLDYSASYNAVTYDTAAHHATGGSIDYTINASHAASGTSAQSNASFSIDAVVAFNADGSATITLDGTHAYTLTTGGLVIKI